MPDEPQTAQDEPQEKSPMMRALSVAMVALPIMGLLFHGFLYATAPAWSGDYLRGLGVKAVALLSFANLVGNWFHYRRTQKNLDLVARILTYLWILSIVLLMFRWKP